jgi:hypothetical protein
LQAGDTIVVAMVNRETVIRRVPIPHVRCRRIWQKAREVSQPLIAKGHRPGDTNLAETITSQLDQVDKADDSTA